MSFELPALPYERRLAPHILPGNHGISLRQTSPDLCHQLNNLIKGTDFERQNAGRDRPQFRRWRIQQRCSGVEPHLLLALHGAKCWRRAGRQRTGCRD